jgi:tetratricopeptide (TPR) repeat protein
MVRILVVGCLLSAVQAAPLPPPPAIPAPSPKPTVTPLTLLVRPGQADVKMIVGVPGPGQPQVVKLWSDQVVRALLRGGFTLVDDPKQKHDAELKLALAINPQTNTANITVTVEDQGQLVDIIEDLNRGRWNTDGAANGLVGRIKGSQALIAFAVKKRGPSNTERAKQLHESATRKFDLGKFDDAVKDWSRAYELDAHPQFLYNIGNAYRRKGEIEHNAEDLRRAQHFYRRFADNDPAADIKSDVRETDALLKKLETK